MKIDEIRPEYDIENMRHDQRVMRQYAAIRSASEDKIGCPKIYVDIAGGIEEAFILDELVFFTLPKKDGRSSLRVWKNGVLWMAVRRSEWWERKRLTSRQSDRAILKLVKQKLVEKEIFLFNAQPTIHIRLNVKEFFSRYTSIIRLSDKDQNDTIEKDISDLYAMMGVSPNGEGVSPNGEGVSPNGEGVSPNGDFINSIDTVSTQYKYKRKTEKKGDLLDGILAFQSPTAEKEKQATDAFERAFGIERPWTWYPAKDTQLWDDFRAKLAQLWEQDHDCFKGYARWANDKYSRGAKNASQLRRDPGAFWDAWAAYKASEIFRKTDEEAGKYKPLPKEDESQYVKRPLHLKPNIHRPSTN